MGILLSMCCIGIYSTANRKINKEFLKKWLYFIYKKIYNAPILLDENYFKKKYEEIEQFLVNLVEKIL